MRRTVIPSLLLASGLLAGACASTDSGVRTADAPAPSSTAAPPTTVRERPAASTSTTTTLPDDPVTESLSGREILSRVEPSMAFVETMYSTGSGMVVGDRYVLTNLHVVEPFGTATVTIGGSDRIENVPVLGVDVKRDLALLGPIDTDAASIEPQAPTGLQAGDELFLVGYPGEVAAAEEPTISRGILSRVRREADWDLTYLQTDAAIAAGQSGGALLDRQGRVVGISGLSMGDGNFALALAGDELSAAITDLVAGGGDRYRAIPDAGTDTSGTISLVGADGEQAIVLQNDEGDDVVWHLTLDPAGSPLLWIIDDFGTPLFANDASLALVAEQQGSTVEDLRSELGYDVTASREVEPGVYDVRVPAGSFAIAYVGTTSDAPVSMAWTSSVPLFVPADDDDGQTIAVGDSLEGITEFVESYDTVTVDLTAGQPVRIAVRSPLGDPAVEVAAPGQKMEAGEFADDSNEGMWGLDAVLDYTPTVSGTHRIRISSADGFTMFWRLTVDPA